LNVFDFMPPAEIWKRRTWSSEPWLKDMMDIFSY